MKQSIRTAPRRPPSPNIVDAVYRKTGVTRWDDNPFATVLPPLPGPKLGYATLLEHKPPVPNNAARRKSEVVRMNELMDISDIVYSFTQYARAAAALDTLMHESYVARNPMKATDIQRRHAIATGREKGFPFPADWKSSALGLMIISHTGNGKSTLVKSFLALCPQVIHHSNRRQFFGKKLPFRSCHQIVYLYLWVPHDGTLRSFCLQFCREVDKLLGTNYARRAKAIRNIAPMKDFMGEVATAVSLSFVVIDDLQNVRNIRTDNPQVALDYFAGLIEGLGISVVTLATPAVKKVLKKNVRSFRKLASVPGGVIVISPMKNGSREWILFTDTLWEYMWVRTKLALTPEIRNAWHNVSGGNPAFAVMAFMLAQRNAIGGREIIDAKEFERAANTQMAFLQPAIAALRSGKESDLERFEDLLFGSDFRELQELLGMDADSSDPNAATDGEFEEEASAPKKARGHSKTSAVAKKSKRTNTYSDDSELPMEDPLVR